MERPPEIPGERVLQFASLAGSQPTSGVEGSEQAWLAIVQTDDEPHCVYLYFFDSDWNLIGDTWHEDVASALQQAAFWFQPAPKFQEVERR